VDFSDLEAIYRKWLHLEHDPHLLRLLYASFLANKFDGPPVWTILVGPAGAGKTELLLSLTGSPEIIAVSNLTPYSLATGFGDGSESLLHRLDGNVLVVEDMSAITEMPKEGRSMLFSFLRAAYNGEFTRVTGRNTVEWRGKFGMLAGATLALEHGKASETSLGERFLNIRLRVSAKQEREMMAAARTMTDKRSIMKAELAAASGAYLGQVRVDNSSRKLHADLVELIENAAIALSRARSGVLRDGYSKDLMFPVESSEIGTRLQGQFILLALAARALGTDWKFIGEMIYRIMLDSIPYVRLKVIQAVHQGYTKMKDITEYAAMSGTVTQRIVEELRMLGILERNTRQVYMIAHPIIRDALEVAG
jgi:hypothetical protein